MRLQSSTRSSSASTTEPSVGCPVRGSYRHSSRATQRPRNSSLRQICGQVSRLIRSSTPHRIYGRRRAVKKGVWQCENRHSFVQHDDARPLPRASPPAVTTLDWTPESWRTKVDSQAVAYEDTAALEAASARMRELPP